MRIESSSIAMESDRSYQSASVTMRRYVVAMYDRDLMAESDASTAVSGEDGQGTEDSGASENTESTEDNGTSTLQNWQNRFTPFGIRTGTALRSPKSWTYEEITQQTIRYIYNLLFGKRRSWLTEEGMESAAAYKTNAQEQEDIVVPATGRVSRLRVLNYTSETFFTEKEGTSFSTVGTVKTADGRELGFQVNVGMSREFQEYYREDLKMASFLLCDPLVINLDTDVAKLSDQTIFFDIDADGKKDEISGLSAGSGFLTLDKNGDGVINDGSELFGTKSGDGFRDLAQYDEDGNGWIDENDTVWDKLQIWTKDENGEDVLYRLSEKGVGAICLQKASTEFTQKGCEGQTLGAVRSTGIFLYENGTAGTIQQVDVAKYDYSA